MCNADATRENVLENYKIASAIFSLLYLMNILKPLPIVGRRLPYGQILGRLSVNGIITKYRVKTYKGIEWIEA
jgi:hypothetical protein